MRVCENLADPRWRGSGASTHGALVVAKAVGHVIIAAAVVVVVVGAVVRVLGVERLYACQLAHPPIHRHIDRERQRETEKTNEQTPLMRWAGSGGRTERAYERIGDHGQHRTRACRGEQLWRLASRYPHLSQTQSDTSMCMVRPGAQTYHHHGDKEVGPQLQVGAAAGRADRVAVAWPPQHVLGLDRKHRVLRHIYAHVRTQ
jgi:hypothetical protein